MCVCLLLILLTKILSLCDRCFCVCKINYLVKTMKVLNECVLRMWDRGYKSNVSKCIIKIAPTKKPRIHFLTKLDTIN